MRNRRLKLGDQGQPWNPHPPSLKYLHAIKPSNKQTSNKQTTNKKNHCFSNFLLTNLHNTHIKDKISKTKYPKKTIKLE